MEQTAEAKKIVFSGIQPSGGITLGNYLGALEELRSHCRMIINCVYSLVDLHAITVRQDPATLRRNTLGTLMRCCSLAEWTRRKVDLFYPEPRSRTCGACLDSQLLHTVRRAFPHDAV